MNLSLIPKDSILQHWIKIGKFMEAPYSYLVAVALSGISSMLRRNAFFDIDEAGVITPNLSIILIGPTGIGKDTAFNMGRRRILDEFMKGHRVKGVTSEAICDSMYQLHNTIEEPSTNGYLIAEEMKALFGGKDYQQGMFEVLTDLLSDKEEYTHATKTRPQVIPFPTLVLQAGSTEEWFHQLPAGALAGGFVPRCLVVVEKAARQMLPLPKDYQDFDDRKEKLVALDKFWEGLARIEEMYYRPREVIMDIDAKVPYENWYHNRYKLVGPLAQGYAHRARGHVAKMAMICAATRGRPMIEVPDIEFAVGFMDECIATLEAVIVPPTEEGRCIAAIKAVLPATQAELVVGLRPKFQHRSVVSALGILRDTGEIVLDGRVWQKKLDTVVAPVV